MPPDATDERTFTLRFSLSAKIAPAAWDDEDFEGDNGSANGKRGSSPA